MFDAVCKFLVETFSADFSRWLLGEAVTMTELSPSELLLEPIRADALLLQTDRRALHLEFQTQPDPTMAFRMLDYWVRLHRRLPQHDIKQVVIYLLPSQSPLVFQTQYEQAGTRHTFEVIRLWEQPTAAFLSSPGLLPLATLSQTSDRAATLRQVAGQITRLKGRSTQSNVAASTAILSGLVLEKRLVQQILRRELMQESVIYQDIKAEGLQEGLEQGLQQGLAQGERQLVLRQLDRQVGTVSLELSRQIEALPVEAIESLGEALLDFANLADLQTWLANYSSAVANDSDTQA